MASNSSIDSNLTHPEVGRIAQRGNFFSRRSNPFSGCGRKIQVWGESHPRMKKALIATGIVLAILIVMGGALFAYMHFSGLGISKAGFAALGSKISALMHAKHPMSTAQLLYQVVLPAIGGTALLALLAFKGKAIKKTCSQKIEAQIDRLREWNRSRNENIPEEDKVS